MVKYLVGSFASNPAHFLDAMQRAMGQVFGGRAPQLDGDDATQVRNEHATRGLTALFFPSLQ